MHTGSMWKQARTLAVLGPLVALAVCSDEADPVQSEQDLLCVIPRTAINQAAVRDGIPALTNPELVDPSHPDAQYVRPDDRVVGIEVNGQPIAVPHNLGWWHEVFNFDFEDRQIAVTHCPLTGSSLVFDRAAAGGAEFGVSGLLFMNNLMMFDRVNEESFWPQMARGAGCGPRRGARLDMVPSIEMTWDGWLTLHPDTKVVSSDTGFERDYRLYPYGGYDRPENGQLLFPVPIVDTRRSPKERVLGIPGEGIGGIAFPFGALDDGGPVRAVHEAFEDESIVVFWDAERRAAMAFHPAIDGEPLEFEVRDGRIVDTRTGSGWRVDGRAVNGPLAGRRLGPIAEAYVAFWFAWVNFQGETRLWTG